MSTYAQLKKEHDDAYKAWMASMKHGGPETVRLAGRRRELLDELNRRDGTPDRAFVPLGDIEESHPPRNAETPSRQRDFVPSSFLPGQFR